MAKAGSLPRVCYVWSPAGYEEHPPHPGDGPIFWFVRFMALGGGALFFWVGVRDFPRVLRRNRVRMKAKRPERVGPHPVWDIPSIFTATQAGGLS